MKQVITGIIKKNIDRSYGKKTVIAKERNHKWRVPGSLSIIGLIFMMLKSETENQCID
jgi:hypothetical protein